MLKEFQEFVPRPTGLHMRKPIQANINKDASEYYR